MNIFFTVDEAMLGPMTASIFSLWTHNNAQEIMLFIAHDQLSEQNIKLLKEFLSELGIKYELIEVNYNQLKSVRETLRDGHVSSAGLFRCIMDTLLPSEITKILYIDCDTVILSSLRELYDIGLKGAIAGVVNTPMDHLLLDFGVSPTSYFNSGVMLIDLSKWRDEKVQERVFEIFYNYPTALLWWDQCALNIVLKNRTVTIPPQFNYIFDPKSVSDEFSLPTILHYAGTIKPWDDPLRHPWGGLYLEMSVQTPWYIGNTLTDIKIERKLGNFVERHVGKVRKILNRLRIRFR